MPRRHFYLLRHHILYSYKIFVLLFVDSRWNQLFNLWERGGDRRKVTKCNTYKNSLSFTMVSLQFSKKFYYSGCLTSSLNPVKKQGDCPEVYNFYFKWKHPEEMRQSFRL